MADEVGSENESECVNMNGNGNLELIIAYGRDRAIRENVVSNLKEVHPGIVRPEIKATKFEFEPMMFQLPQTMGQFSGISMEDPHLHIKLFVEASNSFKLSGVLEKVVRMKLFSFSFRDRT